MWSAGDTVVWRGIVDGRVRWATPHTLIELTAERVAWLVRPGTVGVGPAGYVERRRHYVTDLARGDWVTETYMWHTHRVLRLTPFGRAHSLDLYWRDDELRGWYVNLQEPLRASRLGWDTRDHALDLWRPAGGEWQWKDEDELAHAVELGIWTPDEAAAFRAEGERVLGETRVPTGWEEWRPDPAWPLPELPPDWERV